MEAMIERKQSTEEREWRTRERVIKAYWLKGWDDTAAEQLCHARLHFRPAIAHL
jgi:hypothetical protein